MATKANATATATAAAKRTAPVATSGNVASTTEAEGTPAAVAAAPQAALFVLGSWPNVQQGSIRHYAKAVAAALTTANPNGFTLAAYKVALVAGAAASSMRQPGSGWAGHNMPTWAAHSKQGWLVAAVAK